MNVLVTGGAGIVGRPLVSELRRRGKEVWVLDQVHTNEPNSLRCDIAEYRQLERVFEQHRFDYVYHLAAEFGRKNGEEFYESLWRTNVIGTKNIIRLQERHGFRLIFASSSEVYGNNYTGILTEDVPDRVGLRLGNDYAISKWVGEIQILNSASQFGTESVRYRLSNMYGPGEHYTDYRSVVCTFIHRVLLGVPYVVYLRSRRGFVYVDDAIVTVANIVDRFNPGEVYNIAADDTYDIKYVSDLVLRSLGKSDHGLVEYKEVDDFATMVKEVDSSKAKGDLGHACKVSLEEGIKRTIEWQRKAGYSEAKPFPVVDA